MSTIIRDALLAQGVSQREAAERIGISLSHLTAMMGGKRAFTVELAIDIQSVLNVDAGMLLAEQAQEHADNVRAGGKFDCASLCLGGGRCVLDADVYHVWHICSDSDCECHSRFRYEPKTTGSSKKRHATLR